MPKQNGKSIIAPGPETKLELEELPLFLPPARALPPPPCWPPGLLPKSLGAGGLNSKFKT